MDLFDMSHLIAERTRSGKLYHEFLNVPSMSAGVYQLPAGGTDPQQPHTRDELYVVVAGSGRFVNGDERHAFEPGDVLFVPAGVVHRFEEFTDDLVVWVVFYGPEGGERAARVTH